MLRITGGCQMREKNGVMLRRRIDLPLLSYVCVACLIFCSVLRAADVSPVKVREEKTEIPTYLAGPPEPDPLFFFGRSSQGAQGPVYPYPMYDTLTGKKVSKTYTMVYLENEYVRIGILPEIGGRIFEAVDKTNNYNFVYRQHVIKPALIGLIGAWISGGVEWNIPHHHRASTFTPVQYSVEENADGSKTVWVGELEVRQRMRWAVGYTLRPGKAYFEAALPSPPGGARDGSTGNLLQPQPSGVLGPSLVLPEPGGRSRRCGRRSVGTQSGPNPGGLLQGQIRPDQDPWP